MRRSLPRAAALLCLLTAGIVCSDAPTGTRPSSAFRLAVAPRFQGPAAAIFANMSAFSLAVDNVHLTIRPLIGGDALGAPLKDTTVAFPADEDELRIVVDVAIPERSQELRVEVELREGTIVYFEGSATLLALQGQTSGPSEPIDMSYVGPGVNAAFLTLNRFEPTIAPSSALQFAVTAYDAGEHIVNGLPIAWSSSDVTVATVTATGLVTSTGKVGTTTIKATALNGLTDETTISVQPVARLALLGGDKQSAIAGLVLPSPFVVQAFAATDRPVIGASITFSALTSGGSVGDATVTTGDDGTASTTLKLGAAIGAYSFRAAATGLPSVPAVTIGATALSGLPVALAILSGNSQAAAVGTILEPLIVQVKDALGNPIAGTTVTWRLSKGSALLYPDPIPDISGATDLSLVTASDGTSRIRVALGTLAGPIDVTASVPGTSVSPVTFSLGAVAGAVAQIVIVRQPSALTQAAVPLATQPVVRLVDQFGNFVAKSGVRILAMYEYDCSGTRCDRVVKPPTQRSSAVIPMVEIGLGGDVEELTDANGIATYTSLTLNLFVGSYALSFMTTDESAVSPLSTPINVIPGDPVAIQNLAWIEDTLAVTTSEPVYPQVQVTDAVGNGVQGVPVIWAPKDTGNLGVLDSSGGKGVTVVTHTDDLGLANAGYWTRFILKIGAVYTITASAVGKDGKPLAGSPVEFTIRIAPLALGPAGDARARIARASPQRSAAAARSNTGVPPTTVMTIFASRIVSGGMRVRSRSTITKSASKPAASVPFSFSANSE